MVGRLLGGAGPGGTDLISLQHWLLRFGAASGELRLIVAEVGEWLSNGRPTYNIYLIPPGDYTLGRYKYLIHQGFLAHPHGDDEIRIFILSNFLESTIW